MRHDESRLGDILDAAARITQRLAGVKRREFLTDEVLADSGVFQLYIITEAAGGISPELKNRHKHVRWDRIRMLRNTIAHEYFALHLPAIWKVVTKDVPILEQQVKEILEPALLIVDEVTPLEIKATGHNSRQMCRMDKYGFPRTSAKGPRTVKGFRTGDLVLATVTSGKKIGCYEGRVAPAGQWLIQRDHCGRHDSGYQPSLLPGTP
jgi:uncharacterized protein with HEPN domain